MNAWKEHLGHVSVLAFLDPAWQYSFRQAVMLEMLSSRLRKSGFPDIRFFVISPSSDSTENESSEDDLEIEAWREIGAKHEMDNFVDDDFLRVNETEITFLRDDSQSRVWRKFRASRDQVVIIDRCGKLAYHVIVPWSILFFPYVKAAILSTYMEDPCGGCNPAVYRGHEDHFVNSTNTTNEEEASPTQRETETNDKPETIWITESPENATLHYDESDDEREASTASPIPLEQITSDTSLSNLSTEPSTESTTYQYDNDATESRFEEDRPDAEGTKRIKWDQEDQINSKNDGIAATFKPELRVLPLEQARSHSPVTDNSVTSTNYEDTTDRTLLLDDPAASVTESDSTSVDEETTTLNITDKTRDGSTTPENIERFKQDAILRIIMYAPHVHKNDTEMKKYTHLILKIGDPDFHGHFDSGVDVASPTNSQTAVNSLVSNSEEYDWRTAETEEADDENANQKYIFGKDESPGLYGEVADYWKSYEDSDITDRNQTSSNTYNNSTTSCKGDHRTNGSDHAMCLSPEENHPPVNVSENSNVKSFIDPQNIIDKNMESSMPNDQIDSEEERIKLIEHYNKLLSWIDYKLIK